MNTIWRGEVATGFDRHEFGGALKNIGSGQAAAAGNGEGERLCGAPLFFHYLVAAMKPITKAAMIPKTARMSMIRHKMPTNFQKDF